MSYPATISISWSSAVSIIICTLLIFLISSQKSNPLPSGSPTSEIIKSTLLFSKTSLASFMLKAVHTIVCSHLIFESETHLEVENAVLRNLQDGAIHKTLNKSKYKKRNAKLVRLISQIHGLYIQLEPAL